VRAGRLPGTRSRPTLGKSSLRRAANGIVLGAIAIAAVSALIAVLDQVTPAHGLTSLYLFAILPVAIASGFWVAGIVAVASYLTFAFFFAPPIHSFAIGRSDTTTALVTSIVSAYLVSVLAQRTQARAREARLRAAEAEQARLQVRQIADEQAALRRVATLVARRVSRTEIFETVTREVGLLFGADLARLERYEDDGTVTGVGVWSRTEEGGLAVGTRIALEGVSIAALVKERGRPMRIDSFADAVGPIADEARSLGIRSSVGCPIVVAGRVWGVIAASSRRETAFPPNTELQIGEFTELVATAIANAEAREELRQIADEQAALRRVATSVAQGASPTDVFAAVADELAQQLGADIAKIFRFEPDNTAVVVGGWSVPGMHVPIGTRLTVEGEGVAVKVKETGQPARTDRFDGPPGSIPDCFRRVGARSGVGSPIVVEGVLWGMAVAAFADESRAAAEGEAQIGGFTELVATAIANAQARDELREIANEQAALRRVATLVARGATPGEVLDAVSEEVRSVFDADGTLIVRRESDGEATIVAHVGASFAELPIGSRRRLEPPLSLGQVLETGRPARVDYYREGGGELAEVVRATRILASVASPIVVEGRLWGGIVIGTESEPFPVDTEQRMLDFTELVATAIANAEAQAELTTSRARVVASADDTRRRIERDLHDGAQQHLVSLALQLRAAQASVPPDLDELATELDRVVNGLTNAFVELREFARGIHPAILAEGGLGSALKPLVRRSAVPVELDLRAEGRLPEPVEVAAYYIVSEALANAAKHAQASKVSVDVEVGEGMLHLRVHDDGVGGADFARGSGLVGLKDRVGALGGRITLQSEPGAGTSLAVELPFARDAAAVVPG
jgi:signal transduction histidine kinase